jgi:hypothetical protein
LESGGKIIPAPGWQNPKHNIKAASRVHQPMKRAVTAEAKQQPLSALYCRERARLQLLCTPNGDKFCGNARCLKRFSNSREIRLGTPATRSGVHKHNCRQ